MKVVYVLVFDPEDSFYEMFLLSLYSLRLHEKEREVEVVLDKDSYNCIILKNEPLLQGVKLIGVDIPEQFDGLQKSRYLKTTLRNIIKGNFLYIDTDTLVCEPLTELETIEGDIAAVADWNGPVRIMNRFAAERCRKAGFTELEGSPFFNGGVFFVKDSEVSHRFFNTWHRRWLESLRKGVSLDQPALCQANLDMGCLIMELPGEWNCQVCSDVGPHYLANAKIIHYYASYGSFQSTVIVPHVKEPGMIDSVAKDIAHRSRFFGTELFQHSYMGHFKGWYSELLFRFVNSPVLFKFTRGTVSALSKPLSWFLAVRKVLKKPFWRVKKVSSGKRDELLGRGLVAMRVTGGVYLSWRILSCEDPVLGTAEKPLTFIVLRDGAPIAELSGKTNYLDPDGAMDSEYVVRTADGGESKPVRPFPSGENWFDIPLERPVEGPLGPYMISDVSTGDLDGDGEYELVVKWDSAAKDNSVLGMTGKVLLDAYKLDGTRLWDQPIDLGVNIRAGAQYTQFLVYDFDCDGKSEVVMKTAPGSKDGKGRFVNLASSSFAIREVDNSKDFRDSNGMVLDGDEFLTVFRGDDGGAIDTIYYPNQRVDSKLWGDEYGNRSERYTAAVAWMDGERPSAVYMRGYYWGRKNPRMGRQSVCSVTFDGKRMSCQGCFDTFDTEGYSGKSDSPSYAISGEYKGIHGYRKGNERYIGEGNHNCAVADVDGDGREEVLTGALCYKLSRRNHLRVKWCTFLGHGDALHLGAYDPKHKGFEFFTVHECGGEHPIKRSFLQKKPLVLDHGFSILDARNRKIMFHVGSPGDMGRGVMADVGAGGSYQFWGVSEVEGSDDRIMVGPFARTDKGFEKVRIPGVSTNFRIFWDGTLRDNLLDGDEGGPLQVTEWNGKEMERIFVTKGCVSINGTKATPCLQADILGDWREEIVMAREDNEALRIFVSDIPTDYSFKTPMHDPVYRAGVAAEQTAYNQPPHIGFCLKKIS